MPHYNQYTHQPARISLLMKRLKESPLTSNESIWPYSVVASTTFEATFAVSIGSYWGIFWGLHFLSKKLDNAAEVNVKAWLATTYFASQAWKVETHLPFSSQTETLKSKIHFIQLNNRQICIFFPEENLIFPTFSHNYFFTEFVDWIWTDIGRWLCSFPSASTTGWFPSSSCNS